MMVMMYVDDLVILVNYMTKIEWLKSKGDKEFDMSDFEQLHFA